MRQNVDLLCASFCSPWRVRIWRARKQRDFYSGDRKVAGFVSLSMPFNQHSGATYLKSKSYLVVEISSDIVTQLCCQLCILSMVFCRSDPWLRSDIVSDCAIGNLEYHVVWLHSDRPTWEVIWKIFFTFDFTLTETHRCYNYSLSLYFNIQKDSPELTNLLANETVSIIVGLQ